MAPFFVVEGGHRLSGTIRPAGNKNAALPILAATLLADGPCVLDNVPRIRDVETMLELLVSQGVTAIWNGEHTLTLDATNATSADPDPALCAKIRASVLLAGPMLARFGRVRLPPPGGDVIGRRRIDTHLLALQRLGAEVEVGATFDFEAKQLVGAEVFLDEACVTGTENALMAAVAARRADGAQERRVRAPRPGPGALPRRAGRADRGDRHQHRDHRGRAAAQGRALRHRPRPHRDRLVRRPRGGHQLGAHHRGRPRPTTCARR